MMLLYNLVETQLFHTFVFLFNYLGSTEICLGSENKINKQNLSSALLKIEWMSIIFFKFYIEVEFFCHNSAVAVFERRAFNFTSDFKYKWYWIHTT